MNKQTNWVKIGFGLAAAVSSAALIVVKTPGFDIHKDWSTLIPSVCVAAYTFLQHADGTA